MTNLRERPIRLESVLTQDYINRAAKMKELEKRVKRKRDLEPWLVGAGWLLVIGLLAYVAVNY